MRKSGFWLLLALIAALALVAAGCGGDDDDGGEPAAQDTGGADTGAAEAVDCTAAIGIMGPFTGDVAAIGQEQLNWAKFAVDRFNEERGTTFSLVEGDTTVSRESVSQDQTDFSALASAVADDTDVVFLPWQVAANAQLFGNQLAEQGKDAVIFGSDGLFSPDDFSIAGSYVSSFAPDITGLDDPAIQELVAAFEDEYGDFGTFGPPTYAATTVVMEAATTICEGGEEPTREAILEQMPETDMAESILGQPIRFTENGDIEDATFFIFQVGEDGSYELVE